MTEETASKLLESLKIIVCDGFSSLDVVKAAIEADIVVVDDSQRFSEVE